MKLNDVVPWGRSLDEYRQMFGLDERDLGATILGCADGPASFNAELTRRGGRVVSADPIYAFSADEIAGRVEATAPVIAAQLRAHADDYVWTQFRTPEDLVETRRTAMRTFLDDYEAGRTGGRYVAAALPDLPFPDDAFDLALCSHFLFLYADRLTAAFHRAAVRMLLRVAREIRIFPLLTLAGERASCVDAVIEEAERLGGRVRIERVDYEVQRGGNRMLRITRTPNSV